MIDDHSPSSDQTSASEACREDLWMASLDRDAIEGSDGEAPSTAERLRRLEAFSAA